MKEARELGYVLKKEASRTGALLSQGSRGREQRREACVEADHPRRFRVPSCPLEEMEPDVTNTFFLLSTGDRTQAKIVRQALYHSAVAPALLTFSCLWPSEFL